MMVVVPFVLAGTAISIGPSIPTGGGSVTVGDTGVLANLSITNNSTSPQNVGTISVTNATLTVVPGVFSLSATGTGDASTPGCAGSTWTISGGPTTFTFTPTTPVNLTSTHASPSTLTFDCQINFTVNVLSRPAFEPTPYTANVVGVWSVDGTTPATGSGGSSTTINKATPTLTTTASGPVVVGATITDTAHLSGGVGTLTGTMAFQVYAPGDTTCATPLTPQPTGNTVTAAGDFTSGPFTTTAVGTYRWRAFFTDTDGNNNDVSTACNDTGESSTVTNPQTGEILPTNTECSDFVNNTTPALTDIFYRVNGGNIAQSINPGVFFYYTFVTVGANGIAATSQHSSGPLFTLNQGHAWLYTATCGLVSNSPTLTGTPNGSSASFSGLTPGTTYVLRLQYSTKSIAGKPAPATSPTVYFFDMNGTDNASVRLTLQ